MSVWGTRMTGLRWNQDIIDWDEYYNHRSCLKKIGADWSRHHSRMSRGEDWPRNERPLISIAHPSCAWDACGPTKRLTFNWRNVQMHSIWRQYCIVTKFRIVIKSTWFFFRASIFFHPGNTLCNESMYRHHVSVNLIFNFCIRTVGLIFLQFTRIHQLHIPDTSTKIYENWMSASSWFVVSKKWHRPAHKRTEWPTPFHK